MYPFYKLGLIALALIVNLGVASRTSAEVKPAVELPSAARAIFRKHCYSCHGKDGIAESGLFILEPASLAQRINRDAPAKSALYRKIMAGSMPPDLRSDGAAIKERPTQDELKTIFAWLTAGAPAWESERPTRKTLTLLDMANAITADLDRSSPPSDRKFYRYVSLTHLHNNPMISDDQLQSYRNALVLILNQLSRAATIYVPVFVDADKTILRIDLRRLGWNYQSWLAILSLDPYAIDIEVASDAYEKLCGCLLPLVRGDWLVYAASRDPLYSILLGIPKTVLELEAEIRVNAEHDRRRNNFYRVAFVKSGVSRNPRRFSAYFTGTGSLYESEDTIRGGPEKDPLESPLDDLKMGFHHEARFAPDGREIIYQLPNGLFGFMLANAKGERVNEAPTSVVSDIKQTDRVVRNAISCMRCHHAPGLLIKADEVTPMVKKNPTAFRIDEREAIFAVYRDADIAAMMRSDNERRDRTFAVMGISKSIQDPMNLLARRFEEPLDLTTAALEVGKSSDALKDVISANPRLARRLGNLLVDGGRVSRDQFLANFGDLAVEANRGVVSFSSIKIPEPGTVFEFRLVRQAEKTESLVRRHFVKVWENALVFDEFVDGRGPTQVLVPRIIARKELVTVEVAGKEFLSFFEKIDHDVWTEERFVNPRAGLVKSIVKSKYTGQKTLELRRIVAK